ncbi:MAG: nucleotide sugar dehydrogenase, partial [Pelagibacterales bacterium]|nr:nucleotide sugar dehydrogenase [Pelagibacterales bacterium]
MKINNICCIGAGYVGGPTMAVIAQKNPNIVVTVVDINEKRIAAWNSSNLNQLPIYEPGLSGVVKEARGRNLFFSTDINSAITNSEMIFISVNTPTKTSGEGKGFAADLKYIELCANQIAEVSTTDKIVVEKSTVPVRTSEKIKEILNSKNKGVDFQILSNPEFLAEGTAMRDLQIPDRVIIGGDNTKKGEEAIQSLVDIYSSWVPKKNILTTNLWSAELSKLTANAFLAQRISSINSLSELCEETGADIEEVAKAIGMDSRIGSSFLKTSVGFGGSCFQKDILNLVYISRSIGLEKVANYWEQILIINKHQRDRFAKKIKSLINSESLNNNVCMLGWAFKKDTNDTRESAAIYVSDNLIKSNINLNIYDPKVKESQIFFDMNYINGNDKKNKEHISIYNNPIDCIHKTNIIAILTEWDEFKDYDWKNLYK